MMKLGADRKKIYVLGGLVLIGGYLFYSNVLSGPSSALPEQPKPAVAGVKPSPVSTKRRPDTINNPSAAGPSISETQPVPVRQSQSSRSSEEFRPSLKPKRPEERADPMSIDPTLRLDLLAKVQAVNIEGGRRNLFQAGAAPLPPEPAVPVKRGDTQVARMGPQPEPAPPGPITPVAPVAPPITLKYYGYSSNRGDSRKHAFFLDGEDILVAAEGETVKKRYRVVRIGVNSVVMEDTQYKHEQTLPLQQEAAG
jgi:hypothetical protein